jgi:hypothetical protein
MSGAPWDSEPRITVLARASNNLSVNKLTIVASTQKDRPPPLIEEEASSTHIHIQERTKILVMDLDGWHAVA